MIIYNAIRTPDGTVIESKYRHDYVSYLDTNGFTYFVDGGHHYLRRGFAAEAPAYTDISIDTKNEGVTHEVIREHLRWGTRGPMGNAPLTFVLLKELTTSHILAILETQHHISQELREIFNNELTYRKQQ